MTEDTSLAILSCCPTLKMAMANLTPKQSIMEPVGARDPEFGQYILIPDPLNYLGKCQSKPTQYGALGGKVWSVNTIDRALTMAFLKNKIPSPT